MSLLRQRPLPPRLAAGVRRLGFRKWYERELLASHAHLLLTLLSVIALLASLEMLDGASPGEKLLDALLALVSAAVALWALRRYLYLLMRAEDLANQATCAQCDAYGKLLVLGEDRPARLTRVQCKRCDNAWDIVEG